jgi:hypothetical protein
MSDSNVMVRVEAAARCLASFSDEAGTILKNVRDADGECSFTAELVLEEYRAGKLNFDY